MSQDEEEVDDFLVFQVGNDDDGIVRGDTVDDDQPPVITRYVSNGSGITQVSDFGASTDSLGSRRSRRVETQSVRADSIHEAATVSTTESESKPADTAAASAVSVASAASAGGSDSTPGTVENQGQAEASTEPAEKQPVFFQNAQGEIERVGGAVAQDEADEGWQDMETVGTSEMYDDKGVQTMRIHDELTDLIADNAAASGYTKVIVDANDDDDDAKSINSLDEKTDHLFDKGYDTATQIQSTREMLQESQRIAYAGLCRVIMAQMEADLREHSKGTVIESLQRWASRTSHTLYAHLGLSNDEQIMIEQLVHHGVLPSDLSPSLRTGQTVLATGDIVNENDDSKAVSGEDLHADVATEPEKLEAKDRDIDVRWTVLCDLFLNLVVEGVYDSRSRVLLEKFGKELGVSSLDICQFERKVTDAMQIDEGSAQTWEEGEIIEQRRKQALHLKYAFIGLATVGGGLVIGLSAGLLAPVIGAGLAAGLTTIGIGGTSGFLAGAGGAALVTTTGVALGAQAGHRGMKRRLAHVKTFEFRPVHNKNRVNLVITVSGWMNGKEDDVRLPYSTIDPVVGDMLSVYWEPEMMQSMGQTINIVATEALTQSVQQILGATILTGLMASLQLPMALSKLSYLLDNPWNVSLDRAWAAGLILADTLISRNLGSRPVTLVGFSLGARVIYSCLVELARRGAYGLVQEVFIFGAPVALSRKQFRNARSVVSGRFVNGYSTRDWILGYLFRATSGGISSVLGLAPIKSDDIENLDVTEMVQGHMEYRRAMPKLLSHCGWPVFSDVFDEINDPDPNKLREKQLKLIAELNDEKDAKKSGFSRFFSFGGSKRKEWLKTAQKSGEAPEEPSGTAEYGEDGLFDLEALEAEVGRLERLEPEMVFDVDEETKDKGKNFDPSIHSVPYSPRSVGTPELTNGRFPQMPKAPSSRLVRHHRTASKSIQSVNTDASVEMSFGASEGEFDETEEEDLAEEPMDRERETVVAKSQDEDTHPDLQFEPEESEEEPQPDLQFEPEHEQHELQFEPEEQPELQFEPEESGDESDEPQYKSLGDIPDESEEDEPEAPSHHELDEDELQHEGEEVTMSFA